MTISTTPAWDILINNKPIRGTFNITYDKLDYDLRPKTRKVPDHILVAEWDSILSDEETEERIENGEDFELVFHVIHPSSCRNENVPEFGDPRNVFFLQETYNCGVQHVIDNVGLGEDAFRDGTFFFAPGQWWCYYHGERGYSHDDYNDWIKVGDEAPEGTLLP